VVAFGAATVCAVTITSMPSAHPSQVLLTDPGFVRQLLAWAADPSKVMPPGLAYERTVVEVVVVVGPAPSTACSELPTI
jgi:hypothetical protein